MCKHEVFAVKQFKAAVPKRRNLSFIPTCIFGSLNLLVIGFVVCSRFYPMLILKLCPWSLLETIMPICMTIYHL
jgi:hypothetical protein